MIEHVFSPEMMKEREKQLALALLDCAGVYYDINFAKDMIIGNPLQVVDGVVYPILELIGKKKNCTYTEIIEYWSEKMPETEVEGYIAFSAIENIKARYAAGERSISHRFRTYDVLGNSMIAEQTIRLYEDCTTGDLLGLVYVSNGNERDVLHKKEEELERLYKEVSGRIDFLEAMSANIPGGYHRCGTGGGFPLEFVSDSFLKIVGWSREEIKSELDNMFINLVAPEDHDLFMAHEPALVKDGYVNVVYRIIRKDGTRRWVQDSTLHVEKDGKEYYQCILADITDYVEGINEARKRAEASNQAKSAFLFNASHDIRTPMNAISGFARIIEKNADDPEVVKSIVKKIIQSSNTLMTLLNDVLELSRIERGKEELNEENVCLHEYMKGLYEMFASEMEKAQIGFETECDIIHSDIECDLLKMTRIGMNMLSNAKKFTPAGGRVILGIKELESNESSAKYYIYTRDTGIGMSDDFKARAFEQFERERSSTESGVPGSGLGLAIIQKLCSLMGGECGIESELGKGTEVSVTITFKLAVKSEENETKAFAEAYDLKGKRVLLVEDNDFNREIAKYMLTDIGLLVDEAENGEACIGSLNDKGYGYYDCILMDVQMPVMDGYAATRHIRGMKGKLSDIPIIAMTANAFEEDKRKCIDAGMNGHVSKPVDIDALICELKKYCI